MRKVFKYAFIAAIGLLALTVSTGFIIGLVAVINDPPKPQTNIILQTVHTSIQDSSIVDSNNFHLDLSPEEQRQLDSEVLIVKKEETEIAKNKLAVDDRMKQREIQDADKEPAIHRCFTEWDGSCPTLVAYIKENMNDPDSFEHVETTFTYHGNYFFIIMKYRGKNAFGGKVLDYVKANVNSDKGQVLKVWK